MSDSYLESDGKSVNVDLLHTVAKGDAIYADGFLGLALNRGDSGGEIALNIDRREYQFYVPSSLTVNKGDTVYATLASITAHVIPDGAYSTSSGAGKKALFKATSDRMDAADGTKFCTGLLLPEGV